MVVLEEKCFTTSFRILKTFLKVSKTVTRPSKTIRPRHAVRVEGLRGVALVQDYASSMRCAVRTCVSVRGPFAHDFHFVSSLIGHPQATSFLSSFSAFSPLPWHCQPVPHWRCPDVYAQNLAAFGAMR